MRALFFKKRWGSCSNGRGLSTILLSGGVVIVRGIDSDFDGNGAAADLFALQRRNGLLLLCLATNVHKTVALAPSGLAPAPLNDASGNDIDACISEEGSKGRVIDGETEVGDEEHGFGGLANGVFTSRPSRARCPGLARTGHLLRRLSGSFTFISGRRVNI